MKRQIARVNDTDPTECAIKAFNEDEERNGLGVTAKKATIPHYIDIVYKDVSIARVHFAGCGSFREGWNAHIIAKQSHINHSITILIEDLEAFKHQNLCAADVILRLKDIRG